MDVLKYLGLIKTLGFKFFIWKGVTYIKKKLGFEMIFEKKNGFSDIKIKGVDICHLIYEETIQESIFSKSQKEVLLKTLESLPNKTKDRLINNALKIALDKRLTFFSKEEKVIDPIDFNFDYFENISWEVGKHSSRYFQFDKNKGDIKKVWELSRLQFLNPLVLGYLLIKKGSQRNEIRNYLTSTLQSWFDQNPFAYSVAWACSQETAIRGFNLIIYNWIFDLKDEPYLRRKIANTIHLSSEKIYREINFARAQRNNHSITESMFLILVSSLYPSLPNRAKYLERGNKVLIESIKDQFFKDGTYIQNSHTYQRFALQNLLIVLWVSKNIDIRNMIMDVLERSHNFFKRLVSSEDGDFPNYGHNDGSLLFNWGGYDYRNLFPIISLMSKALGLNDPQMHPFCLDQLILNIPSNGKKEITQVRSDFSNSGYYIFEKNDFKVHFRCGSYINRYPSQCDMLHVDLWYKGKNILVDNGTFTYYSFSNPALFSKFLSTSAHNTIKIGPKEQMEKGPRFTWFSTLESEVLEYKEDLIVGQHNGYKKRVAKNTIHKRTVEVSDLINVKDEISDIENQQIMLYWHLGDCQLERINNTTFLIDKNKLFIKIHSKEELKIEIKESPRSLYYGVSNATPSIEVSCNVSKSKISICTEIIPYNY